MVRQLAAMVLQLGGKQRFDGLCRAFMQFTALCHQQGVGGHLLGERMLEGILHLRESWPLMNVISRLQLSQQRAQLVFGERGDMLDQA
ncbi:hypothetical protein D3C72_1715220 [compost metagenome]